MQREFDSAKTIRIATGVATASFLILMTTVCMLLRPEMFDHPHWGLSYFGDQHITLLPYYGGFLIVIACLAWITRVLGEVKRHWRPIRFTFLVATVLTTAIAATSSMQGAFLYWSHIYLCFVLLLVVLVADIWVLTQRGTTWLDYGAMAILLFGTAISLLSSNWLDVLGIYYWGEVVLFVGAFACLGQTALRAVSDNS